MDRRAFFRRGISRVGQGAVELARARAEAAAARWVRPPFAAPELDLLVGCTRCGACAAACPHGAIFLLPARVGAAAAGTPALDLVRRACHLCADWPCVSACERALAGADAGADAGAGRGGRDGEPGLRPLDLRWGARSRDGEPGSPEGAGSPAPLPRPLARLHVDRSRCLPWNGPECGACDDACPVPGALVWKGTRPELDPARCLGCGLCRQACILDPAAIVVDGPALRAGGRVPVGGGERSSPGRGAGAHPQR